MESLVAMLAHRGPVNHCICNGSRLGDMPVGLARTLLY